MPDLTPPLPVAPIVTTPPSVTALSRMRTVAETPAVAPPLAARIANRYQSAVSRRTGEFSPFFVRLRRAQQARSETGGADTGTTSGYGFTPTAAPVSLLRTPQTAPPPPQAAPPQAVPPAPVSRSARIERAGAVPVPVTRAAASVARMMGAEPPLSAAIAAGSVVRRSASFSGTVFRAGTGPTPLSLSLSSLARSVEARTQTVAPTGQSAAVSRSAVARQMPVSLTAGTSVPRAAAPQQARRVESRPFMPGTAAPDMSPSAGPVPLPLLVHRVTAAPDTVSRTSSSPLVSVSAPMVPGTNPVRVARVSVMAPSPASSPAFRASVSTPPPNFPAARVPFATVLSTGAAAPPSAVARTAPRVGVPDLPAPGRPSVPQALWRQAAPEPPAPVERTYDHDSRDAPVSRSIESHSPARLSRANAPVFRAPAALPRPAFLSSPRLPSRSSAESASPATSAARKTEPSTVAAPSLPPLSRTGLFTPVFTPSPSLVRRTAAVPALAFLSAAALPIPSPAAAQAARAPDISPPMLVTQTRPAAAGAGAARSFLPAPFIPVFSGTPAVSRLPEIGGATTATGAAYRSAAHRTSVADPITVTVARQGIAPLQQPQGFSALTRRLSRQGDLFLASALPSAFVTTVSRPPMAEAARDTGATAAPEPFGVARQIAPPVPVPVSAMPVVMRSFVPHAPAPAPAPAQPSVRRTATPNGSGAAVAPVAQVAQVAPVSMTVLPALTVPGRVNRTVADSGTSRVSPVPVPALALRTVSVLNLPGTATLARQTTTAFAAAGRAAGAGSAGVVARIAAVPPLIVSRSVPEGRAPVLAGALGAVRPVLRSLETVSRAVGGTADVRTPGTAPFAARGAAAEIGQVLRSGTLTTESLVSRRAESPPSLVQREAEGIPAPAAGAAPDAGGAGKEAGTGDLMALDRQVDALWDRFMQRFRIEQERSGYH